VRISISIPLSGIDITASISDQLGVSMEEAEILKYECGLDPDRCEDKLWKVLLPLIDDMTDKIRNALTFYRVGFPQGKKIEKILLCGGGARFKEIDTVLSRKLTIKVRRSDPLVNAYQKFPRGFHSDHALPFATAIGLGLHAADENEMYHRFL
jgi:Tfp pilus assembly PilM family ATPase